MNALFTDHAVLPCFIDTHCHLDASEFEADRDEQVNQSYQAGVGCVVIPAVAQSNFVTVQAMTQRYPHCVYALGIHPLYVPQANATDLAALRETVVMAIEDKRFVAIGEIGLDYFVPMLTQSPYREKQEYFFVEQLKIAREFNLPVLLHVRRAQDHILKHLRRFQLGGGIAHAFNGSLQQAQAYLDLGFVLGFGGAMTFERALQIRRLATELPLSAIVLETDAPDIAPAWRYKQRNSPTELPRIAQTLSQLRGLDDQQIAQHTTANARRVLPRLI